MSITAPLIAPAALGGVALVFMSAVKELPVTLLLSPDRLQDAGDDDLDGHRQWAVRPGRAAGAPAGAHLGRLVAVAAAFGRSARHPSARNSVNDAAVQVAGLTKFFGSTLAVDAVDLEVAAGGFLALLGPSGCGKSTTLRLIAGFEAPDAGSVWIGGQLVADPKRMTPPERRHVGMVFQEGALFPHLTVAANIGYGLAARAQRNKRVDDLLELVGLPGIGNRMPHELSGGQQQRVALARALAPEPTVVLLDEPFSSLDAGLRARLRLEVRAILRQAGATAISVTHDQDEAFSLADEVAVMWQGRIVQRSTPGGAVQQPRHARRGRVRRRREFSRADTPARDAWPPSSGSWRPRVFHRARSRCWYVLSRCTSCLMRRRR